MHVHVVPPVNMKCRTTSDPFLAKSGLHRHPTRRRVAGRVRKPDPMKSRFPERPLTHGHHRVSTQTAATHRRHHPIRHTSRTVAVIDTLQRHSPQHRVAVSTCQRPVQLRLLGPTTLPCTDQFTNFINGVGCTDVPALNLQIGKGLDHGWGVGDVPRPQNRLPADGIEGCADRDSEPQLRLPAPLLYRWSTAPLRRIRGIRQNRIRRVTGTTSIPYFVVLPLFWVTVRSQCSWQLAQFFWHSTD